MPLAWSAYKTIPSILHFVTGNAFCHCQGMAPRAGDFSALAPKTALRRVMRSHHFQKSLASKQPALEVVLGYNGARLSRYHP